MSYTRYSPTNYTDHDFINKSSAVAEIGDRLATVDMVRKVGGLLWCAPFPGWESWVLI